MAYEQRDQTGGAAVETTIAPGISGTDLSIVIGSATNWPAGGANGPFFVAVGVIDAVSRDFVSNTEKIEIQSRTGTTLTVANTGKRGIDGTSALTHASGETIRHIVTKQDIAEANTHIANTALDHHTQYLNTTRHDVTARHDIGSVIPATGTPSTITPDAAASNGSSENVARVDHTHAIVAATAVTSGLANAEGASTSFARADHTHDQAALSVGTAELVDDSVTNAKIGAAAIDDENFFSSGLSPVIVAGSNPGAVGGNRIWFNTASAKNALLRRNAGDTAWEVIAALDSVAFTPATFNMTLGNGVVFGRYSRIGKTIVGHIFHRIGSTTVFGSNIGFGLPAAAADLDSFVNYPTVATNEFFGHGGARGTIVASGVYAAVGIVPQAGASKALDRVNFFATAGSAAWGGGIPGGWLTGDRLSLFFTYEAASSEDTNYV